MKHTIWRYLKNGRKISQKTILYSILLLISGSCNQYYPKSEAEKQLRVFDNEIIQNARQISATQSFQALQKLLSIRNLPLPFQYSTDSSNIREVHEFDFEKHKGIYRYKRSSNELYKSESSDSIIIIFPYQSKKDTLARFILSDYSEEISAWNIMFPTKLEATIKIANHTLMTLNSESKIEHGFPIYSRSTSEFGKFRIENQLHTKLSKRKGKIGIEVNLYRESKQLIRSKFGIIALLNNDKDILFDKVKIDGDVYPINIKANIQSGDINQNASNYINEFNANSSITIYKQKSGKKVGKIILVERPGHNKLNFAIKYNDSSYAYLEDFLLSYKTIMNVKL